MARTDTDQAVTEGPVRSNRPDVIDEAFDGEVTLIHLGTGLFYGLDAPASAIWLQVRDGRSPAAAVAALASAHDVPEDALRDDVTAFLGRLHEEGLVVPADAEAEPVTPVAGAAWAPPKLDRFEDMADLLLLDPVHDIQLDADGWPIPRDAAAGEQAA